MPSFLLAPQQELALDGGPWPATQVVVELPDKGVADDLRRSLALLVERHEILRTTFVRLPGLRVPQQVVHAELPAAWNRLSGELDAVLEAEAAALDPEHGPVIRAALVGQRVVLTAPVACVDAQAMTSILGALLGGTADGPEPVQYADYAVWRHQLAEQDPSGAESAARWWAQGPAPLEQPLFQGRAGACSAVRKHHYAELDSALAAAVRAAAERSRVTPAIFLEACLHALAGRVTGESEFALAGLADGRGQPDLAAAVGPYAQLVPIRSHVEEQTTVAELVDQVGRARVEAARNQDFASTQQLAFAARAAVGFAYLDTAVDGLERLTTDFAVRLALVVRDGPGGRLGCDLAYDPAVYGADDVGGIAASFSALVAGAAAESSGRVTELPLLSLAGRAAVLSLADGGTAATQAKPIPEAFAARAAATPDALAVTDGSTRLTYAELNAAANRLAHHLRGVAAVRGAAVGLCLDRSPDALVAMLAILKAGAAFVPLTVEHPALRLEHQLREVDAVAVVTRFDLFDRLPRTEAAVVCLDNDAVSLAAQPDTDPRPAADPDELAYVMYTSGSTGVPKGVSVTHGNVANYTARMLDRLGDVNGLRFAVVSALSADLSYTSVFPALAGGGSVHLVPPDVALDPERYATFAQTHGIDVLKITPSLLDALLGGRAGDVLPRRWLICGGEPFTFDLLARIREAGVACRILNHYGPTETTIGACALEVDSEVEPAAATVPIGRPFANSRAYVVDGSSEPVPVGVAGELWIGGAGVARGYVKRPEETAQRFIADPFAGDGRVYRTGDRARFLRGGAIEFLGRVDRQVKIRGYRVEPGEVEAALLRHPVVRQAAVVVQHTEIEPRLVAYVTASGEPAADELRSFLAEWVPAYMLPSIVPIDVLPLTPSGKLDRQALASFHVAEEAGSEYVAPRNDLEREIAEIWQELLGVQRVGVTDDFFALGGHSLLATQMITRIRRRHRGVPLGALFNSPTVSGLAEVVGTSAPASLPEAS